MDKPETEEALKQNTEWTNQRHMQYWNETHNGQTRVKSSIDISHMMDKLLR
jgi:hypothetical protein